MASIDFAVKCVPAFRASPDLRGFRPPSTAHLGSGVQLLRSRPSLLCRQLHPAGLPNDAAAGGTALPKSAEPKAAAYRAAAPLSSAVQKSDASRSPRHPPMIGWRLARRLAGDCEQRSFLWTCDPDGRSRTAIDAVGTVRKGPPRVSASSRPPSIFSAACSDHRGPAIAAPSIP